MSTGMHLIESDQRVKTRLAEMLRREKDEDKQVLEVAARDEEILFLATSMDNLSKTLEDTRASLDATLKERNDARKLRDEAVKAALEAKGETERLRREVKEWENLLKAAEAGVGKMKQKQQRAWDLAGKLREENSQLRQQVKSLSAVGLSPVTLPQEPAPETVEP
jgi:chromosome segregation ATPase